MLRSVGGWLSVVGLTVLVSACTGGGGGGGGSSNEAPVAVDDIATTSEDTPVGIDVLANDTDADADDLVFVSGFTEAANGTVSVDFDGTISYAPDPDFSGSDTFSYTITDGRETATANVAVTISTIGDMPVTVADAYAATEDIVLVVAIATGVLANDDDVDSPGFTAVLDNNTADGTVALAADGSFTYTPDANFSGSDSFTYHATDGANDSSIVVVTIAVAAVNDAPVADADGAYAATEDTLLTVAAAGGLLAGDVDPDGDALVALLETAPSSGTLTLAANGGFTYLPNANFAGPTDSFTYRARDGATTSAPATVSLTIAAVNDAPVGVADGFVGTEDTLLSVAAPGVLANDTDADAGTTLTAVLVISPINASSFTLNANGSFSYTPNNNFTGGDTFTYRAFDGTVNSGLTTVTINILNVNDIPLANGDIYNATEDTLLSVAVGSGVLSNDSDVEGSPLAALLVTPPSSGSLTLFGDGSFNYLPNANFFGGDSFTYVARDGVASSGAVTVSITVGAVNDVPVAVADSFSATEDTPFSSGVPGVLANDSDVEGAVFAVLVSSATNAASFTLNANGSFSFTPSANFNGVSTFTYRVQDLASVLSPTVTVTLNIAAVNDAPVATNDAYATNEDTQLVVNAASGVLLGGTPDSDVDGNALNALLVSGPSNGTLSLVADGSFTYTPALNFAGPTDTFTYRARDAVSSSGLATVTITVNAVNDAPVASGDSYSTSEDTALSVSAPGVLGNDSDVESPITAVLVSGPANAASFTLNPNGSFSFTPATNFNGSTSFTYRANDGTTNSATVTVNIAVGAVNDPPSFSNAGNVTVPEDSGPATSSAWATSISAGPAGESSAGLAFAVVAGNPAAFAVQPGVAVATGNLTFTPAANAFGSTPVTISLVDGEGARSAPVVVQITFTAANDPPQLTLPPSLTVNEDSGTTTVPGFATITGGPGGEPDAYYVFTNNNSGFFFSDPGCMTLPNCGQPFIDLDGRLVFRLAPDAFGSVSVNVTVQDIYGVQTNGSFILNITNINDAPSFTKGPAQSALDIDGQRVAFGWANPSSAGPNEGGQALTYTVTNDNNGIFSEQPNIDSFGTLRFTPFGAGTFGSAVVSVFVTDNGSPPLSSATQTFSIVISNPAAPPGLISSTPDPAVDGTLSYEEAFGPGGQLSPAIFAFNDPNLNCPAVIVDVTLGPTTLVEDITAPFGDSGDYFRDCSFAGQLRLQFQSFLASSAQSGDSMQIDLTNIFDTELPPNGPGAPVTIVFTYDSQAPSPSYLDNFFSCSRNARAIAKFNETMDQTTASTFVYEQLPQGAGSPVPVVVEPTGGVGFATLDNTADTYYFVPRDYLVGLQHRVYTGGFRDVAGNLAVGQTDFQFSVCGFGGGPGPGGVQLDRMDFLTSPVESIDDTEIVSGFTLVGSIVAGKGSGLDLVFTQTLDPGFSNGSVREEQNNNGGGGPSPEFFATVSGNTLRFRPTVTSPGFTWKVDASYSVNFNICTTGPGQCTSGGFSFQVKVAGDTVAPRVLAVAGRRSSASPNNARPLLRPEEPLRIGISEQIDQRTLVPGNFVVTLAGNPVPVTLPSEDDGGFGGRIPLRADRGDGQAGAFAPGVYTLTVSGLLDIAENQNLIAPTQIFFEVGALGGTPAFVSTLPQDGDDRLDTNNLTVFAAFTDAMSRGSFTDTGAGLRGFRLEEQFQGSFGPGVFIPKKGLQPASTGCCGGSSDSLSAVEPEIVGLRIEPSRFIGFRQSTQYRFKIEPNLKNADGTMLGGASGPTVAFFTADPGEPNVRPTISEFRMDVEVFEPNTLRFSGFPLTSHGRVTVRFDDPNGSPWNLTVTGAGGSAGYSSFATSFSEMDVTDAQLATFFAPSTPEDVSYLVEDAGLNASLAAERTYVPAILSPATVTVDTAGQFSILGTMPSGSDAALTERIEIAVAVTDDSSGTPDIREFVYGAMAQIVRNADGSLSYSHQTVGLVLPDRAPFTYRVLSLARIASPRSTADGQIQTISRASAPIPPNAPALPVTLSGTVNEDNGVGGGPAVAGALVQLVGTSDQTTTDANGFWSLTVPANQLRYLRVTKPGYHGIQVLVTTVNLPNFTLPLFTPAGVQSYYDAAGVVGPIVDVAAGSVYLEPNPSVAFTAGLGALTFDDAGGFGGNQQLFQNVLAGTSTLTLTGPSPCSVNTFGAFVPSPLSYQVAPNVLTYVPMECSP